MDLKNLLSGRPKDVKVEWLDHMVMVTFDPMLFTPALQAKVSEAEMSKGVVDLLVRLLKGWDITENGEPYPINETTIGELPLGFLTAIVKAIGEELQQDPSLRGTSDEPS